MISARTCAKEPGHGWAGTRQNGCSFKMSMVTQLVGNHQDVWPLSYNEGNAEECQPPRYKISAPVSLNLVGPCQLPSCSFVYRATQDCFLGLLRQKEVQWLSMDLAFTNSCLDWLAWATFKSALGFKSYSQTQVSIGIRVHSAQEMSESDTVPLIRSVWGRGDWDWGESIRSPDMNVQNIKYQWVQSRAVENAKTKNWFKDSEWYVSQ